MGIKVSPDVEAWILANAATVGPSVCLDSSAPQPQPTEQKKPTKHRNKPVFHDGIWFQSTGELDRWLFLVNMEKLGAISGLKRQVSFDLHAPGGEKITSYKADFVYTLEGKFIVEDFKGHKTEMYLMKKKWMEAEHGIIIKESTRKNGSSI